MKGQTHGGKGSGQRPTNKRRFEENYEKIFNKTPSEGESQLDEGVHTPESDGRSGESKFREYAEGAGVQGQADQEQAVEPVAWHYIYNDGITVRETVTQTLPLGTGKHYTVTPLYTQPLKRKPMECPYPCGWNNLYSIIVQKGAYLAQSTLGEDAIFTSHQRNEMVRIIDFARTLCEWGKNTLPPKREPLSDDEIDRLRRTDLINVDCGYAAGLRLARLIEKAHGIGE